MSHLDEGTLHALLDGELGTTEVAEIQAHLGSCAACGARLREVKDVLAEADRLVAVMELPPQSDQAASSDEAPRTVPLHQRGSRPLGDDPAWNAPPVLLIPDNPDPGEWRRHFLRWMGVAATIAVAVGAGYIASEVRRGAVPAGSELPAATGGASASGGVVSPEETVRSDSGSPAAPLRDTAQRAIGTERRQKTPAPPQRELAKARSTPPGSNQQRNQFAAEQKPAAPEDTAAPAQQEESLATVDSEPQQPLATDERSDSARELAARNDEENIRAEAARATAELDRERLRQRAAAATAALEAAKQRERDLLTRSAAQPTASAAPVTVVPTVRTPEQRAQIYLRIGLDEGARQLGGPVHVIEGMSPLFMGLVQGRLSPGADPARPVVRVVYQDAQGRLIFLDQQRIREGQGRQPAGPGWTVGETRLNLHGEVSPEILKTIRPRVR